MSCVDDYVLLLECVVCMLVALWMKLSIMGY